MLSKVYLPMVKYWIEDHYEEESIVEYKAFKTEEEVFNYLIDIYFPSELRGNPLIKRISKDEINYAVTYSSYLAATFDDISKMWGMSEANWYYAQEVVIQNTQ